MSEVVGVEDDFDVAGDFAFEVLFGDMFQRVFLQVELTTLPGRGVERGLKSSF